MDKLSPLHYCLRTCSNKPVSTIAHANRMKPFIDPNDRPIEPPVELLDDLHFADNDFPLESFVPTTDHTGNHDINTDLVPTKSPETTQEDTQIQDSISKTLVDNEEGFEAEKILKRQTGNGNTKYLVKWTGYPLSEVTWEPLLIF